MQISRPSEHIARRQLTAASPGRTSRCGAVDPRDAFLGAQGKRCRHERVHELLLHILHNLELPVETLRVASEACTGDFGMSTYLFASCLSYTRGSAAPENRDRAATSSP